MELTGPEFSVWYWEGNSNLSSAALLNEMTNDRQFDAQ